MIGREIQNYRIEELIGEGGMGTVFRAVDTFLGRDVALKMLHPNLVSQTSFYERFRNEAQILAKLNHPNIATLHNFLEDKGDYFMVMEFIEGADLELILKSKGVFSVEMVLKIIEQSLTGVSHAHQKGVLHRDLKPANLILTSENQIKIMDFGIAKVVNGQKLTQVNRLIGTLEYLAPELLKGGDPSVQSDLYAIGVVTYELLCGKMPFKADTDYELMQKIINTTPLEIPDRDLTIPSELKKIIKKLLDKNPKSRYATAALLKDDLIRLQSSISLKMPKPTSSRIKFPIAFPKIVFPKLNKTKLELGKINKVGLIIGSSLLLAVCIVLINLFRTDGGNSSQTPIVSTALSDTINENILEKPPKTSYKEASDTPSNSGISTIEIKPPLINQKKKRYDPPKIVESKKDRIVEEKEKKGTIKQQEEAKPPPKEITEDKKIPKEEKLVAPITIHLNNNKVVVALNRTINSSSVSNGQTIDFTIAKPLVIDGKAVFTKGGKGKGFISDIKSKTALRKEALEIRVKEIQASNGQWIPVKAAIFRQVAKSSKEKVSFEAGQQFVVETTSISININ